jgi:hypothetical protein
VPSIHAADSAFATASLRFVMLGKFIAQVHPRRLVLPRIEASGQENPPLAGSLNSWRLAVASACSARSQSVVVGASRRSAAPGSQFGGRCRVRQLWILLGREVGSIGGRRSRPYRSASPQARHPRDAQPFHREDQSRQAGPGLSCQTLDARMETLVQLQVTEAPTHPVLPNADKYDLRCLRFEWSGNGEAFLEMELSTHDDYATLRFEGVEGLHVESGDVPTAVRVQIQDTSGCPSGTHHIPAVRVGGTGSTGLSFWASKVERIANAASA